MSGYRGSDLEAVANSWPGHADLSELLAAHVRESGLADATVDVVALGKASPEMAMALERNVAVARCLVIGDATSGADVIGEHPVPGPGSLAAGRRLTAFLNDDTASDATVFLVSGGASSLCVLPAPPLDLADVSATWRAALRVGLDITTLNRLRAGTSLIAGGAVLRHVRTPQSASFIMVDNVVSGAAWVASAMTYDYRPSREEMGALVARVTKGDDALGERLLRAHDYRANEMPAAIRPGHRNIVVAEPSLLLERARIEADRRGYRVVNMGSRVQGDVARVADEWTHDLRRELARGDRVCLVGVGEVTVSVREAGTGGRCQEFAWRMARSLSDLDRDCIFVATSSDGRDHVEGVAGAWVDRGTLSRALDWGYNWTAIVEANDTNRPLGSLGQLLEGGRTGWNLCDLYALSAEPPASW